MDFQVIDEKFRRCSTLLQALLAVNSLGLPAGRIAVQSGKTRGVVDFQSSRVTKVALDEPNESGGAALTYLVNLKTVRCRYMAPGEEPKFDATEDNAELEPAAVSSPAATSSAESRAEDESTAATKPKSQIYLEPADVMEETTELDPGVIAASPLKTGVRASLMREQLRRAVDGDDFQDLLRRHKEEFNQVSGKMPAEPTPEQKPIASEPINQIAGDAENGNAAIARAGFVLTEPDDEPPSVDKSLASCTSLLDALLTVSALGIKRGFLEVSGDGVTGTVQFRRRKLVQATISDSDQTGEAALRTLMALSPASCKYVPLPEQAPTPQTANFTFVGETTANAAEAAVIAKKKAAKAAELLPHQRRDADMVLPVEDPAADPERQKAEFEKVEGRLEDIPVPRDVHYMPAPPSDEPAVDRDAVTLARVGFVWDFRDIDPDSSGTFYPGDPSSIPVAGYKVSRTSRTVRKFVLPALVFALCVSIYVVPALLWQTSTTKVANRHQQMQTMADSTYDGLDYAYGTHRGTFQLTPGRTGPLAATAVTNPGAETIDPEQIGNAGNDPSDILEFALADDAATLPRLEQLIFQYIAKKKYRRARDLALAGMRSPYATPADQERFFGIYKQCLHK